MSEMESRKEFEAAAGELANHVYDFSRAMVRGEPLGEYKSSPTYNAWTGWKLGRAALQQELETCEANYAGIEQANKVNYHLMLWEQSKWEAIYRLVFPEEAPWGRVQLSPGVTCSPYQWEKLILRLNELLQASGKQAAEGWQGAGGHSTSSFPDLKETN